MQMNEARIRQIVGGCETAPVCLKVAAYRLADAIHDGQVRKSGKPYITHPVAVCKAIEDFPIYDSTDEAVALLHDTLEDLDRLNGQRDQAERDIADAIQSCCGSDVYTMVRLMAKDGVSEEEYLWRIATNPRFPRLALIKLKDRLANMHDCALPCEHHQWFLNYAQRAIDEVYPWLVAPYLSTSSVAADTSYAIHLCNLITRQAEAILRGHSKLPILASHSLTLAS